MATQWDQISALIMLHSFHFVHIPRDQETFRVRINLQNYIKKSEKIGGLWRDNGCGENRVCQKCIIALIFLYLDGSKFRN